MPEDARRRWHCGYLDPEDWLPPGPGQLRPGAPSLTHGEDGEPLTQTICPGWLVRQPCVLEAWHARSASERGELALRYPGLQNAVVDAADLAEATRGEYEAAEMERMKRD